MAYHVAFILLAICCTGAGSIRTITRTYFNKITVYNHPRTAMPVKHLLSPLRKIDRIVQTVKSGEPQMVFEPVIDQNGFYNKHYLRRKRKTVQARETGNYDEVIEEDFDPFADVDETVADSNEYEDIEQTAQMQSTITEAESTNSAQQAQIDELATKETEIENELAEEKVKTVKEKEKLAQVKKKNKDLEKQLLVVLLNNRATKTDLERESRWRKKADVQNVNNINKLIQLQNDLQKLRAKLGEPDADCTISPCENGGVCLSKQPEGHECLCPRNYKGLNCEIWDSRGEKGQYDGTGVLPVVGLPSRDFHSLMEHNRKRMKNQP